MADGGLDLILGKVYAIKYKGQCGKERGTDQERAGKSRKEQERARESAGERGRARESAGELMWKQRGL